LVKQNLFEGVLSENSGINYVDFSTKGRSQFIRRLEAIIQAQEAAALPSLSPLAAARAG
jgi:hypothetical protein